MQIRLNSPAGFSFQETLSAHGWRRLRPFLWHEDTQVLERMEELADRSVVLLKMREEAGAVVVEVEGDGDQDDVTVRVRRMLQMDMPLTAFHEFCAARPELAPIPARCQGRMLRCSTLFEDAVKDVCKVC